MKIQPSCEFFVFLLSVNSQVQSGCWCKHFSKWKLLFNLFPSCFSIDSNLNEMGVIMGCSKGKSIGCKWTSLVALYRSQTWWYFLESLMLTLIVPICAQFSLSDICQYFPLYIYLLLETGTCTCINILY